MLGHNNGGDARAEHNSSGVLKIGYRTCRHVPLLVRIDGEPIQQHQGDITTPSGGSKLDARYYQTLASRRYIRGTRSTALRQHLIEEENLSERASVNLGRERYDLRGEVGNVLRDGWRGDSISDLDKHGGDGPGGARRDESEYYHHGGNTCQRSEQFA